MFLPNLLTSLNKPEKWQPIIDCIYIAASKLDARFTRICIASVRYFYPEVPIRLLSGGRLQRGLAAELLRYWGVRIADVPAGDYGWGYVKLEPLFGPPGERFLMLDSDTVLTGSILDEWKDCDAPFLVDNEQYSESNIRARYYDWRKVGEIDPSAQPPLFVFNSGQWLGTAGILTREDFGPWLEWTFPRRLRHPEHFFPGDQGILNYVLNQKAMLDGLRIECRKIMRWPGHGLQGLDAKIVSARAAMPLIVHWAGMKKIRQQDMVGADLLSYFEQIYYQRLPCAGVRRVLAACQNALVHWWQGLEVRVRLATRRFIVTPLAKVSRQCTNRHCWIR
jgi:hypothetical protein